jgi:hypothetical protein
MTIHVKRAVPVLGGVRKKLFLILSIFCRSGLVAVLCGVMLFQTSPAFADKYKVAWSLSGLKDLSKLQESEDIDIGFTTEFFEDEEAVTIGTAVLKRELERSDPPDRIKYVLSSVQQVKGVWFLNFLWQHENKVKNGRGIDKYCNMKIDMDKRVVVYEKAYESQY